MTSIPTPLFRTKSRAQQEIELRIGESLEAGLHQRYIVDGKTQDDIAAEWGLDRATISRWLKDCGIPSRLYGPRT